MNTARLQEDVEMIKLPEVRRITGLGTTSIYNKMASNEFPRQVKLGIHGVAWVKAEVIAWVNERVTLRRVS